MHNKNSRQLNGGNLFLLHLLFHRKLERGLINFLQFIGYCFGFRVALTSLGVDLSYQSI